MANKVAAIHNSFLIPVLSTARAENSKPKANFKADFTLLYLALTNIDIQRIILKGNQLTGDKHVW